jgi:trigger factor
VVTQEMESAYRVLNRNVKLRGFRPGKVPRPILERYYKSQVEEEVLSKVINDAFGKAVEENHLLPVSPPTVLDRHFETGKDFTYSVKIEVKPGVTVGEYRGLEVPPTSVSVSDEEVEARLKAVQENHAKIKPLEASRPIQEKDLVVLDFEGRLEGKPLEGWKVQDHLVEAGSKSLVGELDRHLIGLAVGEEKEVTITLPEAYSKKELAGKEIQVHLKTKEIKEKILPSLDDEFAKDVGSFTTLADLKARLRETIEAEKRAQGQRAAKEKILSTLVEKNPFPVPPSMVERRVQGLIQGAKLRLAQQGLKLEETKLDPEKLRESFRPTAEKEIRGSLILEKIAETEKFSVSEAELEKRYEEMAQQLQQRAETVKNYHIKEGLVEDLRAQLLEEKTLAFLLDHAKIVAN